MTGVFTRGCLNVCLLTIGITAVLMACVPWSILIDVTRNRCKPYQVHISLTGDITQMRISWTTAGKGCMNNVSYWAEEVQGTQPLQAAQVEGHAKYYHERMMCSKPAARDSFDLYQHSAVLTDLVPSAQYSYQIAGLDTPITFTAPSPIGPNQPVTFVGFGDLGYKAHWKCPGAGHTLSLLKRLAAKTKLDVILHVGDLAYADGHHGGWEYFMSDIEPLAASIPYMVTIGNHEYDYYTGSSQDPSGVSRPYHPTWGNYGDDSGGECGVMTAARFTMPMSEDPDSVQMPKRADKSHRINTTAGAAPQRGVAAGGRREATRAEPHKANSMLDGESTHKGPHTAGEPKTAGGAAAGTVVTDAGKVSDEDLVRHNKAPAMADHSHSNARASAVRNVRLLRAETHSATSQHIEAGLGLAPAMEGLTESSGLRPSLPPSSEEELPVDPTKGTPKPNSPFWYSYEVGSVHFISLSTEHDLMSGSGQHEWLVKDLKSVDRCVTPWVVVLMHRPMYVVQPHKDNQIVGDHIRANIEPLLYHQQVDLVLSGHVHLYARTCAVLDGTCITRAQGGIYHIIAGTGGHELSGISHIDDWFDSAMEEYGLVLFTAAKSHMKVQFLSSDTGKVLDSVTMKSAVPPGVVCAS